MAWLVKREDGEEWVVEQNPTRDLSEYTQEERRTLADLDEFMGIEPQPKFKHIVLPKGSIFKLIGRELTWKDEPVKLK